jgi:hypothetical protein
MKKSRSLAIDLGSSSRHATTTDAWREKTLSHDRQKSKFFRRAAMNCTFDATIYGPPRRRHSGMNFA